MSQDPIEIDLTGARLEGVFQACDEKLLLTIDKELGNTLAELQLVKVGSIENSIVRSKELEERLLQLIQTKLEVVRVRSAVCSGMAAGAAVGSLVPGLGTLLGGALGAFVAYKSDIAVKIISLLGWDPYKLVNAYIHYKPDTTANVWEIPPTLSLHQLLMTIGGRLDALYAVGQDPSMDHAGALPQAVCYNVRNINAKKRRAKDFNAAIEAAIAFASVYSQPGSMSELILDRNDGVHAIGQMLRRILENNNESQQQTCTWKHVLPFMGKPGTGSAPIGVQKLMVDFHSTVTGACWCEDEEVRLTLHRYSISFPSWADLRHMSRPS